MDDPLNVDLPGYRCIIEDLDNHIRCDNIAAARELMKNCSQEFRRKYFKQYNMDPFKLLLIIAINNGSLESLKFVVDECKVDINELSWLDCSLLCLKHKSRIPLDGEKCLLYPLQYAICLDHYMYSFENIEFLVNRGADVNSTTSNGVTCLILAADRSLDICEFLIEKGANVNAVNDIGQTALHFAVEANRYTNTKLLVERGATVKLPSNNGVTCLMLAAARDYLIFEFLVSNGASISVVDDKGQTAFDYAEKAKEREILKLLVEKGVDPFRIVKHGAKRIAAAYTFGDEETLNALLDGLSLRANTLQLKQIEKHRRLISCYKRRWNDIRPFVAFKRPVRRLRPTLENLQRDLELGLELTSELFGFNHCRFYDALHETATCFFDAAFYDQWLRQLTYNFQTFCCPDLDIYNRFTELVRMLDDLRDRAESLYRKRRTYSFLDFGVFEELLKTIIEEAAKCSHPHQTRTLQTQRDLILLLIRLALLVGFDDQRRQSFRNLVQEAVKLQSLTRIKYKFLLASLKVPRRCDWTSTMPKMVTLKCGADVDERDEEGNNAVHLFSQSRLYHPFIDTDLPDMYLSRYDDPQVTVELARIFVEYGVHLDARNRGRIDTFSCLQKLGIDVKPSINLRCLAARAIRRFNIPISGKIPNQLIYFVKMH